MALLPHAWVTLHSAHSDLGGRKGEGEAPGDLMPIDWFVVEEWPGPMEIPLLLPLVVLAGCLMVLVKGAGTWSLDLKASA